MLEQINLESIKTFTTESLATYSGSEDPTARAEKTAEVIFEILRERGLVNEHASQTFVDVLLSAALLHDLFLEEKGWLWLFKARSELPVIADANELPQQIQDGIFDAIEAQFGESTPVSSSRPKPGTPQEMFAYAVWFVKNYLV